MTQTNGSTQKQLTCQDGESTEVWRALSQYLPSRDPDSDYWWRLTGRQLAAVVEAAGYPIMKQYEALLFHYHWTLPSLGAAPRADGVPIKWKSLMSLDGSPIEYSWKWNTATSGPAAVARVTWGNHFLATLYEHDNSKHMRDAAAGAQMGSSIHLATELTPKGPSLKTYFLQGKIGQEDSRGIGLRHIPLVVSIDNKAPAKSRLKWYFNTPHTSFASVREIMTLGGRINTPHLAAGLADLQDLIKTCMGLPDDFPEDAELSAAAHWDSSRADKFPDQGKKLSGFLYYFDIAPGYTLPDIKVYLPVRYYAHDDLSLAHDLMRWMEARGRGEYCQRYLHLLETLAEHRRLDDGNGLQTFVSCLFKKNGELDITTYLASESFHPARLANRRATRRRET
ncbi:hypothetical protein EPUS_01280 [Endocarpon pusillum Z07020]|uniref:Dimethylallyl tryptophan synthase n=1 Tax=Endocarpon pusillum (strain Z07020 / HMAS-L-300199) TaxID=1263415 RepID=U1I1U7_ENDPU|nr:uncharacterized protein EPUS_01280 [Endocarpon pusillum Z07020]ERF75914.1 hypothetical protein EPUS_01280 [Endocarpon pusillum Z07020]